MYDPTLPGVNEARFDGIRNLLINNLAALNIALTRDGLWSATRVITSDMIKIGNVKDIPDKNVAPLFFCIFGGEEDDRIRRSSLEPSYTNGHVHEFETILLVYIQDEIIPAVGQKEVKERLIARIVDWMVDGTLNAKANERITLPSRVYHNAPDFDYMTGIIESVDKRLLATSYGNSSLKPGAAIVYRSWIG